MSLTCLGGSSAVTADRFRLIVWQPVSTMTEPDMIVDRRWISLSC